MLNKLDNPYQHLTVVRDADMFIGRSALLRRLYSAIASQQCISLVGPRHIGKSSLLTCMLLPEIQKQFEYDLNDHIFVLLELSKYKKKTSEFFFECVCRQIISQCQEDLELTLGSSKGPDAFSSLLEQIKHKGHKLVLVMDSFHHLARNELLDVEFFSYLRAEAQIRGISYITASLAPLHDICRQDVRESPFFNIFGFLNIGPLTQNETQELITRPSQRVGYPFTETEQQWISSLAGRHPFFIQRVCHLLMEEKCQLETSSPDLRRVEELAYAELQPHFNTLLEDLAESEQRQLEDQVRRGDAQPKIHPELSESILFQRFLREKYAIYLSETIAQMKVEDFEEILDQIDDLSVLGESPLRHLKAISTHLENHTPAPREVGRAIRMLLQEALDRLKGNGTRQDSATDWQFYNILYYRYFQRQQFRGKNEQLSARLGYISVRQFYRGRKKAINLLFQEILELEKSVY